MMLKWILATSSYYNSLEEKDAGALYFLEDTQEIYRGAVEYTNSVVFTDELPELAAKGKIYVKNDTYESSVWTGTEWKTVIPQIHTVLDDNVVCNGLVTGEGIKAYVTKKVAEIVSGGDIDLTTDNVVTTREIQVKGQTLGSYKDGDTIPIGENLTTILTKQFAKQIPPTYSAPSYSISPGNSNHESGSEINFTVGGTFTQRDAGALQNYKLVRTVNGANTDVVTGAAIQNFVQPNIQVIDGGGIKFTGTVTYADGAIKNDNLGMPYPTGSIKAGSLTSSFTVTGQRKTFYGRDTGKTPCNDSNTVRALPQNTLNAGNGTKLTIAIKTGDTRVTFAYPANLRDVTSVVSTALNLDVKDTFEKQTIDVEGANGYNPIQYKVYTYIPAIPFASNDTYTVTI